MNARVLAVAAAGLLAATVSAGAAGDFLAVLPAATYDAAVPTIDAITGAGWGAEVTTPEQIVAYARALAQAAPSRLRVLDTGRSLEGRPLVLLVAGAPENMARLDAIRADLARLADPRTRSAAEAEELVRRLPAVVFLAGSVHGDEPSGGDAVLALAYVLAAGRSPEIDAILQHAVVIVDPAQNPDGRARFVAWLQQARGVRPDPQPESAEHDQPWPGGRFSHDLFDLNRDWFALSHPETRARVRTMLEWHPVVVADLHEMDAEQGYFFAPPAKPYNPLVSKEQQALWELSGRANAAAFDARGWRYWTREVFDAFYPGYGESWPYFSGALGMTWEQASSGGLVTRLDDDSLLTYGETVQHHLVTSFTTSLAVARGRERFLRSWAGFREAAVTDGRSGKVRAFVLRGASDPTGTAALADLLASQGLEVYRTDAESTDFVVPLDQPMGRLASALLEPHATMGETFEKEQERRWSKRLPDEIYDLTGWSLPLLWNIPLETAAQLPGRERWQPVVPGRVNAGRVSGEGRVAFLLPWTGTTSVAALSDLLRDGVAVHAAGKPFTLGGRRWERGTLVIRRAGNPGSLMEKVERIAGKRGVTFTAVDTGFVEDGVDLGSDWVRRVKPPRVALLWDAPTSATGAGHLRHALERVFDYPVSVVRTAALGRVDPSDFDVLIMPSSRAGGYSAVIGEETIKALTAWVKGGGVLVAVGGAAEFLCDEKVGLLASSVENLGGPAAKGGDAEKGGDKKPAAAAQPFDYDSFVRPEGERPPTVPGAILRVELDVDHPLAAGFPGGSLGALINSNRIFSPVKLDRGVNVGTFAGAEQLVLSGFLLRASREQLPRKAYLMVQEHGRGKVIAFADDPAARALPRGAMLLLANAVFLGPAF
jgi:hypothetical protein